MYRTVLLLTMILAPAATGPQDARGLSGTWKAEEETNGFRQTFAFQDPGKVHWIFESDEEPMTFELSYRLDTAFTPHHLDLQGFQWGPLLGKTLYCILDFPEAGVFRLDCEPGDPGQGGALGRPGEFDPEDTLIYRRQE